MSYRADEGPQLIAHNMTYSGYEYLKRLISLGAIEGTLGKMRVADCIRPVIDALHVVLAGGEVKIEVVHRGNADILNELRSRIEAAGRDANEINEKSGYYVTLQ